MESFDPIDFYYLAQQIYRNADKADHASARTCINRAYYSAFLTAREKCKIKDDGSGVHKSTINYFKKRKPSVTGNKLAQLFILRKQSDYDLEENITSKNSGQSLKLSKAILEDLGKKVEK